MSKRILYLYPTEGLANRIRAISSAISLSEILDTKLIIVWDKNSALNADFDEIFKTNKRFKVKRLNIFYRLLFYEGKKRTFLLLQNISNWYIKVDFLFTDSRYIKSFVWDFDDIMNLTMLSEKSKKNIAIKTCHQFYHISKSLEYIKPIERINDIANARIGNLKNLIGIHIRRSDNEKSIIHSPLYLFFEQIDNEISNDDSVKFYLATDDIEISKKLLNKYERHIVYFDKNLDRNSGNGIFDAMVDLVTLSKCSKIIGSYWSSFSMIAAAYENTPLQILYKPS